MTTPFAPLDAGWVVCTVCRGTGMRHDPGVLCGCGACDTLGIVVGPPEDTLYLVTNLGHLSTAAYWSAIRIANAYKRT